MGVLGCGCRPRPWETEATGGGVTFCACAGDDQPFGFWFLAFEWFGFVVGTAAMEIFVYAAPTKRVPVWV